MALEIVKNYRENEELRHSFQALAMEIFGIDFESWYQHGFWTERYNPYSILLDGKIVANVSVNQMKMRTPTGEHCYIQLGTVMAYEEYRNRGYIRMLMEEIDRDYKDRVEGFYLFANDSVLDFYPKFGFQPAKEFQMVKRIDTDACAGKVSPAVHVPMDTREDWDAFVKHMEKSVPNSGFEMVDNTQLVMFYLSSFMKDTVYYVETEDAYVVAEIAGATLKLLAIYGDHVVDIDKIAAAFQRLASKGEELTEVKLDFTPLDSTGFHSVPYEEGDCTLFLKGDCWEEYGKGMLRFPELSHA